MIRANWLALAPLQAHALCTSCIILSFHIHLITFEHPLLHYLLHIFFFFCFLFKQPVKEAKGKKHAAFSF